MPLNTEHLQALEAENEALRMRLRESEETLLAIQSGDVDALVVGNEIYTLDRSSAATNRMRLDVLAQMQDAVLACDGEDRIVFMNQAAERQYRRTSSQSLGCLKTELFTEFWKDVSVQETSQQSWRDGGVFRGHSVHQRADGVRIHVDSTVCPLRMAEDDPPGHLYVIRDITEQEVANVALKESQSRLQFILDSAQIGDWTLDLQTGETTHSLRHDQCFGYDRPQAQWGKERMLAHTHPDDRAHVMQAFARSEANGDDLHFECRVIWPDGTVHWIDVHGSSYGSAHGGGASAKRYTGIVADITERKLAEQALHEADRKKDEFLATLAHELRNPLAPIRNALQIMRLSEEPKIQENAREIVERQLHQMVHLVDDLLDVSRISQGKVELRREEADVAVFVQDAIETSRPLILAGKHQLTIGLPPAGTLVVDGDVTRLCQIVANLVNNAAKYTPEGGRIDVSAALEDGHAVITVQDSGIGIPADLLPRVFDMFAQVDRALDRSQGGLGIGLALVKRLVEMHGGTVEGSSAGIHQGSTFTVRLPLLNARAKASEDAELSNLLVSSPHECRVLVVDDNIDSASSLSQVFEMLGYEAATAHDGLEALQVAHMFRPRVVVLDIGLPRMNGHEVAQELRREPGGREMLLIALSGWGQEEDRRKSREAGFDHHFVKPVDLEQLMGVVEGGHVQ